MKPILYIIVLLLMVSAVLATDNSSVHKAVVYCTTLYKPVCADGITYSNSCLVPEGVSYTEGPCQEAVKSTYAILFVLMLIFIAYKMKNK